MGSNHIVETEDPITVEVKIYKVREIWGHPVELRDLAELVPK